MRGDVHRGRAQGVASGGRAADARLELPATTEAPARARGWVAGVLARAGRLDLVADAELVTSELVSNAVLHGRGPITLVVRLDDGGAEVEVTDRGAPATIDEGAEMPRPDASRGRGIPIVRAVAESFRVDSDASLTRSTARLSR